MKLTYILTKQQLLDFGAYLAAEAPAAEEQLKKRKRQLALTVLLLAMVAALSFIRFFEEGRSPQLLLGVGCTVVAVLICYMALRLTHIIKRSTRRQLEEQFQTHPLPETTLDMGDETLLVEEDGHTSILPLRKYTGYEIRGDCRYLLFGSRSVCVPEAALKPDEWMLLTERLKGKL